MTPDERNAKVIEFRRNGATLQQVAERFGFTRQYAGRLCRWLASPRSDDPDDVKGEPCPVCGCSSKTLETRRRVSKGYTYRRHQCLNTACRHRWPSRQVNQLQRNAAYSAE